MHVLDNKKTTKTLNGTLTMQQTGNIFLCHVISINWKQLLCHA
jgi:hypothetical protein